jgi:hypothetical protein
MIVTLPSKENHKPTFRVTPKRRPWYRRLTPAAWLLLGVGGLAGLIIVLGLFKALFGERDIPFVLPPTRTPAVTPSPTAPPTPSPTSTPEAWVWWADEMRCDDRGNCTPPQAVVDGILSAYWTWKEALAFYIYQLDMTPEQLAQYYTGEILDLQLDFVSSVLESGAMRDGETLITEYEYETRVPHVASCRPDGLTCLVGETLQGDVTLYRYNLATRQIAETIPNPEDRQYRGVNTWRFKYDLEDDRWKVERYIEWVPAP